jgi:hypothetical protein
MPAKPPGEDGERTKSWLYVRKGSKVRVLHMADVRFLLVSETFSLLTIHCTSSLHGNFI